MKIASSSKGMKIVPSLNDKIAEKLKKFNKYFGDDASAHVKFTHENDAVRVEITLHVQNRFYRGETSAEDAITALDFAVEVMEGQIRKHKTKLEKKIRDNASMKEYLKHQITTQVEESSSTIIKRKKFDLLPMDPEEATLQMELLGHSFLLFLNMDNNKVNLVYKRKDGNYGLIEPEY